MKGGEKMRVLIYGAGVLGCELAHALYQTEHDITILARGKWKQIIDENGLKIHHYIQRKTTIDQIQTIENLYPDDQYDIIFVVMQCIQISNIIPMLGENSSQKIIFIGNNGDTLKTEKELQKRSLNRKEVAFAFQGTGGRRENNQVISIYKSLSLTLGGSMKSLSSSFQKQINTLFEKTSYRITWENQMDAWLKSHLAFILPICYVCYNVDGHLSKANRKQRKLILDAAYEGYMLLKSLDIPIRPKGEDLYFRRGMKRKMMEMMVFVMCKTPIGRLAASDHAMHAVSEMRMLNDQFEQLRQESSIDMICWQKLKDEMIDWDELERRII